MTWEEIYYIGQTVAVVAILASLVAILLQMHQQSQIALSEHTRGGTDAVLNLWATLHRDPEFARFIRVAAFHWEEISDNQKFVAANFFYDLCRITESLYFQERQKPDKSGYTMRALQNNIGALSMPGVRCWWKEGRNYFSSSFRQAVEAELTEKEGNALSFAEFPWWVPNPDDIEIVRKQDVAI